MNSTTQVPDGWGTIEPEDTEPYFWMQVAPGVRNKDGCKVIEIYPNLDDAIRQAAQYGGWWESDEPSASWVEHNGRIVATFTEGPDRELIVVRCASGKVFRYPMPAEYR